MKKNKELIEEIIDRLKSKEEIAYREGAWERFKQLEELESSPRSIVQFYRYLSAAAIVLIAIAASYFLAKFDRNVASDQVVNNVIERPAEEIPYHNSNPNVDKEVREEANQEELLATGDVAKQAGRVLEQIDELTPEKFHASDFKGIENTTLLKLAEKMLSSNLYTTSELNKGKRGPAYIDPSRLSHSALLTDVHSTKDLEKNLKPRKFVFSDKFDMGLFVSPAVNAENLKVGAGVTIAYKLNNKLSIRTGASYNTYEVGVLKNPLDPGSVEQVNAKTSNSMLQSMNAEGELMATSKLTIPNISAITGFVKSIEIPLEVKYNLNKSFYATAGVSYSTIVSQERNAKYVENLTVSKVNNDFFDNRPNATKAAPIATKVVRSSEPNVETNGYNGFVNLSLGKKVNINNRMKLSVEPYYKIPVGQYRKAESSYSNGGIRLMTNF